MTVTQRNFPFPFKAMAGMHSDIDLTTPDEFIRIHKYLCTNEELPYYGQGLGLPLTSSIFLTSPSPANGLSIFNDAGLNMTREQFETIITDEMTARIDLNYAQALGFTGFNNINSHDANGYPQYPTPWAYEEIPKFIKVGWIDFLHALIGYSKQQYNDLLGINKTKINMRNYAIAIKNWLDTTGVKLEVSINHYNADSNIFAGSPAVTVGHEDHWTDLALQLGLKFIEYAPAGYPHRQGTNAGATSLISPATFPDGGKYWKLTRYYHTTETGAQYVGGSSPPCPTIIDKYITQANLDRLVNNGYMEIFACHYGYSSLLPSPHGMYVTNNTPEFPPSAQTALQLFKSYQDEGKILIATTRNILQYDLAKKVTQWTETTTGTGAEKIVITNFNDTQFGAHMPTVDEVTGLTFYVNDSTTAELWINNTQVSEDKIVRNVADHTGQQSIGIKWHTFTGEDYSTWTLAEVNQGYKSELTTIQINPINPSINSAQTQQFTALGYDQNLNPKTFSPAWTATGGTITSGGLFTPSPRGGNASVTCSSEGISNTVYFVIPDASPPSFTNPQWFFINGDLHFQGEIANIIQSDNITFQYSTDQLAWNDISTTLMGNKYRAKFDENNKNGIYYGRLKVSNNGVEYYSSSVSIDLDSLAPKNPPTSTFTPIKKPAIFGNFKFGEGLFGQTALSIIETIISINQTESNISEKQYYLDNVISNNSTYTNLIDLKFHLENILSNNLSQSQLIDLRQHLEIILSQDTNTSILTDYAGYYESIISNNLSKSIVTEVKEYIEQILSVELSESNVSTLQNYIEKIVSNNISESSITDLQEFYGKIEDLIDIVYSESKIVDIQDYKDDIISNNLTQSILLDIQNYIDNIISNNIDETTIDDIQQFVSNLEEILNITLSQSKVEDVQTYLEDVLSKNLTRSIIIEQYITKLIKILVTLGYVVKFLKLRYSYTSKPLRYSWKVVGTNVGSFKNGIYNVYVGETQEVPIDIETNDINNTNFSVAGTYQYLNNDGTELAKGTAQSNNTIVFANISFTVAGSNQKLIYTYTCTQLDVDGNPKPDANIETGVAVIPINCEKP